MVIGFAEREVVKLLLIERRITSHEGQPKLIDGVVILETAVVDVALQEDYAGLKGNE